MSRPRSPSTLYPRVWRKVQGDVHGWLHGSCCPTLQRKYDGPICSTEGFVDAEMSETKASARPVDEVGKP